MEKFEKWADDEGFSTYKPRGSHRYENVHTNDALEGWLGAIQSLELTPELCQIAEAAYNAEPAIPLCDSPAMKEALHAFLYALKERAK